MQRKGLGVREWESQERQIRKKQGETGPEREHIFGLTVINERRGSQRKGNEKECAANAARTHLRFSRQNPLHTFPMDTVKEGEGGSELEKRLATWCPNTLSQPCQVVAAVADGHSQGEGETERTECRLRSIFSQPHHLLHQWPMDTQKELSC